MLLPHAEMTVQGPAHPTRPTAREADQRNTTAAGENKPQQNEREKSGLVWSARQMVILQTMDFFGCKPRGNRESRESRE